MTYIVKTNATNPFNKSSQYVETTREKNVRHNGAVFSQKITYEKKLDVISRIAAAVLAILATITIAPCVLYSKQVKDWWQQAITGIDQKNQKVVFVEKEPQGKRVKFAEKIEIRIIERQDDLDDETSASSLESQKTIKTQPLTKDIDSGASEIENEPEATEENIPENLFEAMWMQPKVDHIKIGPQKRRIPPLSMFDTIISTRDSAGRLHIQSEHGTGQLFKNDEIVEKLEIVTVQEVERGFYVGYTAHNKAIVQQQATRGCTAGVTAMLIIDHGKKPNLSDMRSRNLGNDAHKIRDLEQAGLKGTFKSASNLSQLRELIINNGSCIVSLSGSLGGHVVVVDDVSADLSKVRLRDPYHGWEITVTNEAFAKEWSGGNVIQVTEN